MSYYEVIEALAPKRGPAPAADAPLSFEEALTLERIARAIAQQGINSGC